MPRSTASRQREGGDSGLSSHQQEPIPTHSKLLNPTWSFFVQRQTLFWVLVECRSPFSAENSSVRPLFRFPLLIVGPARRSSVFRLENIPSLSLSLFDRFPSVVLRFLVRFQNRSLINATQVGPERIVSDRREIEIALAERAEQLWCENGCDG